MNLSSPRPVSTTSQNSTDPNTRPNRSLTLPKKSATRTPSSPTNLPEHSPCLRAKDRSQLRSPSPGQERRIATARISDHKPYLVIADHLTRQGIAVLRFDDRGVGGSTGDYSKATSADLATDVEAGIDFLKNHPKIDASKIGLVGHSEGGLIAPMVAAERNDVHFIVLLAGTGVNGGVILKSQSTAMMEADGEPQEALEANRQVHDAILSLIENNPEITHDEIKVASESFIDSIEDEKTRELMKPTAKQLVAILKSPWVSYFVKHEPIDTLAKVRCHVLAMNGEKDVQVLLRLKPCPDRKSFGRWLACQLQSRTSSGHEPHVPGNPTAPACHQNTAPSNKPFLPKY